jgi:drug/metabolite transporter (DMT)-like permease
VGGHSASAWTSFLAVCAGVGLLASVVGNAFWNRMSRLLPLTMVGQMILFETLFALLYGFLWEKRLPTSLEVCAVLFLIAGVLSCLTAHRHREGSPAPS